MNPKLEKYLYSKYPKIFTKELVYGFECENGWFFLINFLCNDIQYYLDLQDQWRRNQRPDSEKVIEPIEQVVALQIKEKFGSLRFYYTGGDSEIASKVHIALRLSSFICEETGVFDETVGQTTNGWIKTVSKKLTGDRKWLSCYDEKILNLFEDLRD